jgi:hypothetical protein
MALPIDAPSVRCGCTRGVILVTPCTAVAVDRCSRCTVPVCVEHTRRFEGAVVCPACAATATPTPRRDRDDDDDWRESAAGRRSGGGGDVDDAPPQGTPVDPAPDENLFTPDDYDAFDRAGDVDMNAGIDDGFDS